MKKKISILIITSVTALLALSGIQAYLIYNTYQLKKEAFIKETKDSISRIDNTVEMDSLGELWYSNLSANLIKYKRNTIQKSETTNRLTLKTDSINNLFKKYYAKEISNINLEYQVKYKKSITSIIVFDEDKTDTIFYSDKGEKHFLFGENFPDKEGYLISKARWFTEYDYDEDHNMLKDTVHVEIRAEDSINIIGWKLIVWRQMSVLFIFSVLLFLFVVGLLFYSIRNLIRQKKLADVKTDFINNITHELKTPLATVGIATKSLRKKEIQDSPTSFSNTLNILDRQNNRLQKLVDQVLTNTVGSEDIILNKEKIKSTSYFKNVIEDFKLSVQDKSVDVITKIEFREVALSIDKFMFTTALLNILDNAVKYGNEEVNLVFRTFLRSNAYEVSIRDNGIGISQKDQKKIFDKFYRVTEGDIHNVKGLGLGLFYAYQIVKMHNGTISIESQINKGTTFTITLPIEE